MTPTTLPRDAASTTGEEPTVNEPIDADPQPGCAPAVAAAIASAAWVLPVALSASSAPSPMHPRIAAWYFSLRQPWFKPPDAVIPVAWTVLESLMAVGGYRLLRAAPSAARRRALGLWGWNVVMIGTWSRLFFKRQDLAVSTVAAATMVATGAAYVRAARQVDTTAARAALPFVAWVAFATVLTASIWRLNRR